MSGDVERSESGSPEDAARDEALHRKIDWAMGELQRGEQPPDVVASVLARRAQAERDPVRFAAAGGRPSLLSAAIALLALTVVTWLLLDRTGPMVDEAQGPRPLVVGSIDQIARLPENARAVELRGLGDEALDRLIDRCPNLTMVGVRHSKSLTSAVGETLRTRLPSLREVHLVACPNVDDVAVAEVIALPSLRTLHLDGRFLTESSFAPLNATRQLRALDLGEASWLTINMAERLMQTGKRLQAHHGGDAAFARALASLRARYEHRMDRPFYHVVRELAEIAKLPPEVEYVELRKLGDRATELLSERANLRGLAYIRDDRDPFTEQSMKVLATMTSLEELQLNNMMKWGGQGMAGLANLPRLRRLDLSSAPVDDDGLAVLPRMSALRDLELVGLRSFTRAGMEHIVACTRLTRLRLTGCEQLADRDLAAIGRLTALQELDVSRTRFGERGVTALASLGNLERLFLGECVFSVEAARSLGRLRKLVTLEVEKNDRLTTAALLELPVSLRELQLSMCNGLDESACSILRDRFPHLAKLELPGAGWVTDAGLAQILDNRAIHHLMINSCSRLSNRSFDALRDARHLHYLSAIFAGGLTEQKLTELGQSRPDMKIAKRAW